MKILSYNINKFTQEKLDRVLQYDADVFILPEVACPSMLQLPGWFNPENRYFIPLQFEKKLILASWPTMMEQNAPKRYPQILIEALKVYEPYLKNHPTIISGDMNIYKGQSGATKQYSVEVIFDYLQSLGYTSVYHQKTGEELGNESKPTFYYLFKESAPFFLDYTFANVEVQCYELLAWDKTISDHVGQVMEIWSGS